jgi:hypothetical protein
MGAGVAGGCKGRSPPPAIVSPRVGRGHRGVRGAAPESIASLDPEIVSPSPDGNSDEGHAIKVEAPPSPIVHDSEDESMDTESDVSGDMQATRTHANVECKVGLSMHFLSSLLCLLLLNQMIVENHPCYLHFHHSFPFFLIK